MITITDVKIYPFDTGNIGGQIKAYTEITIENSLVLKGFKILQSESGGLFIGYPNQKTRDGNYKDTIIPLDNKTKEYVRREIIDKYKELYSDEER